MILQIVGGAVGGNIIGSYIKDISLGTVGNPRAGIPGGRSWGRPLGLLGIVAGGGGTDVGSIVGRIAGGGV